MRGGGAGPAERIRPGLERIRAALALSGHPERSFRAFHVAGTNGKGSTACFADAILSRLLPGPVGLYTSPHLVSPEERIRCGGKKIPPEALRRLLARAAVLSGPVAALCGDPLSYFEEMTWAAWVWFRRQGVRIAVVETGLGGRWDATTACRPLVTAVTTVGIDHPEWLGRTTAAIAWEKAGILKEGVPAVLGRLRPEARRVLREAAREVRAPLWEWGRDFRWEDAGRGRVHVRLPGLCLVNARIGMAGEFQRDNAATAAAGAWRAAMVLGIPAGDFSRAALEGLAEASWPGRFSPLPGPGNGGTWTDGAHNADAARTLAGEIARLRASGKISRVVALWSMLGDKDIAGFVRALAPVVDDWVLYRLDHERAAPLGRLAAVCRKAGVPHRDAGGFPEAWRTARRLRGRGGLVLVCGSLMAVGEAWRNRVGEVP